MIDVLLCIALLWGGFILGFAFKEWLVHRKYSGTIKVAEDLPTGKITYSLELEDDPERLQYQKIVVFKVDRS